MGETIDVPAAIVAVIVALVVLIIAHLIGNAKPRRILAARRLPADENLEEVGCAWPAHYPPSEHVRSVLASAVLAAGGCVPERGACPPAGAPSGCDPALVAEWIRARWSPAWSVAPGEFAVWASSPAGRAGAGCRTGAEGLLGDWIPAMRCVPWADVWQALKTRGATKSWPFGAAPSTAAFARHAETAARRPWPLNDPAREIPPLSADPPALRAAVLAGWPADWASAAAVGEWATRRDAVADGVLRAAFGPSALAWVAFLCGRGGEPPTGCRGALDPTHGACAGRCAHSQAWGAVARAPASCLGGSDAGSEFERYADAWPASQRGLPGAPDGRSQRGEWVQKWAAEPLAEFGGTATLGGRLSERECEAECAARTSKAAPGEATCHSYSYDASTGRCALWADRASGVSALTPDGYSADGVVYGEYIGGCCG